MDGATWRKYENGLEDPLSDLHGRVHQGAYRAQPSRGIPKADGRQRPLGIASLEDKIVQQAVVTIFNAIYEVDFKGFSYGFRPGSSPHQALDALNVEASRTAQRLSQEALATQARALGYAAPASSSPHAHHCLLEAGFFIRIVPVYYAGLSKALQPTVRA